MKSRIARKIAKYPVPSKRLMNRLIQLYPPYKDEKGRYVLPSWHKYYLFSKAHVVVRRKIRKYGDKFKRL